MHTDYTVFVLKNKPAAQNATKSTMNSHEFLILYYHFFRNPDTSTTLHIPHEQKPGSASL